MQILRAERARDSVLGRQLHGALFLPTLTLSRDAAPPSLLFSFSPAPVSAALQGALPLRLAELEHGQQPLLQLRARPDALPRLHGRVVRLLRQRCLQREPEGLHEGRPCVRRPQAHAVGRGTGPQGLDDAAGCLCGLQQRARGRGR